MTATVLRGPWAPRQARPWPDCRPFAQLAARDQVRLLAAMFRDLTGYWPDLTGNERGWLLQELPPRRPLRAADLTPSERARVADVAATVLRRRAGWAC